MTNLAIWIFLPFNFFCSNNGMKLENIATRNYFCFDNNFYLWKIHVFYILYLSKTVTHHIQLDQLMTNENNVKIEKKDDLIIINIFTGSQSWNRRLHGQTIQPNRKLMSMNLFKILCVETWAWLFLTSMVMKAVRGQNVIVSAHFNSTFGSSHGAKSAHQKK